MLMASQMHAESLLTPVNFFTFNNAHAITNQ